MMIPYNTLSDSGLKKKLDFDFDLQLFGKGDGKSGGKLIGSLLFGFASVAFGFFGAAFGGSWLAGGRFLMGAALFSSVWTATHKSNSSLDTGSPSVMRFDKAQESMSSSSPIPIVYGERKIAGNQTFHETDAGSTTLHKHVVLCEGGIQGIKSVTAQGLLIPTGGQTSNTVLTIRNTKYPKATISYRNKHIVFDTGEGKRVETDLKSKDDLKEAEDATFWEYQVSVSAMIAAINQMNADGWECFPVANTNLYPGDLWMVGNEFGENCYQRFINFDSNTVAGGTKYEFHDCQRPENFEVVGGYPNLAWLDMTFFNTSNLSGNPNVEVIVQGRKVYDPRNGGTKYSTNPALCTLDFLTNKRYGLGKWIDMDSIDLDSFKVAANYCDQIIDFEDSFGNHVRGKRYELNMVIDQRQDALKWLQQILANFSGYLVYSQGKLKLMVERETPISHKFTDKDIKDITISQLELSETPNEYEISIIDPKNNWKAIKCKVSDYADQKQRGRIIRKTVDLDGTTSQYQALRLARFYRDYNLVCSLQLSFTTGMQGMHLEPGDVVTVTYRKAFENLPIRIAEIKETAEHTYEITGRQYNASLYGDILGGGVQWHTYHKGSGGSGLMPWEADPFIITGVQAYTNKDDEILIEHDPSIDPDFKEYRYYVEAVND